MKMLRLSVFVLLLGLWAGAAQAAVSYFAQPTTFNWISTATQTLIVPGISGATWSGGAACSAGTYDNATPDDDITWQVPLGFTFTFAGTPYTQVQIDANGRLQFNNSDCGFGGPFIQIPTTTGNTINTPPNSIIPYSLDFDPGNPSIYKGKPEPTLCALPNCGVFYGTGTTGGVRYFVVTWYNVPQSGDTNVPPLPFSVQAILYANGTFEFQYQNNTADPPLDSNKNLPAIGWEIDATSNYYNYPYTTITALNNTAILFSLATQSDLSITKTGPATVSPGATYQYSITAKNNGPTTIRGPGPYSVTVTDPLPAGVTYIGSGGTKWSCSYSAGAVTCSYLDDLKSGKTTPPITLTVQAPSVPGTITNTANVGALGNNDPVPNNNSSTVVTNAGTGGPPPSPGPFNAVDPGQPPVNGVIQTKIVRQRFPLDIYAIKNGKINKGYNGQVDVYLLDASNNSVPLDTTTACRSSWLPPLTRLAKVTLNNGYAQINVRYTNQALHDARIQIVATGGGGGGGGGGGNNGNPEGCSTDDFALRPAYFKNVSAYDKNWTTPGTNRTLNVTSANGTPIHKAGQLFTIQATAADNGNNAINGYAGSGYANPTGMVTKVLLPAGGATGTLASSGWYGRNSKTVETDSATYSEVGAFDLEIIDTSYASVDAGDGTPTCQLTVGLSCNPTPYGIYTGPFTGPQPYYAARPVPVGRFVPDHFAVSYNTPQFATACGAGQFTYLGQPFHYATRPVITVTAQNAQNGTTLNYTGSLWKITDATLAQAPYATQSQRYTLTGAPAGTTLDTGLLPPTSSDPAIVDNGNGIGTLTFSTGGASGGLAVTRGATPVAPFTADISLSLNVIDTDGVTALTNPAAFNNIAFNSGAQMDYGRIALQNAYGSELMDLAVPMTAQYYAGGNTGFITNSNDSCTAAVSLALGPPYSGNLGAGSTCVQDSGSPGASGAGCAAPGPAGEQFKEPPASGNFNLWLKATGAGNTGSVTATATVPAWLQFPWTGPTNQNPSATASFGLYKGAGPQIYLREVY